jgi:hypothetical protein
MDMNQWLGPLDKLFTDTAGVSGDLANNGTSIGYLLVGAFAILLILLILVYFKRGIGNAFDR